ncbi:hypothetical protein COE15_22540 [Bacillus cereus]|uniref:hypothetical protein n=1 Tax=Bacillus sp. AFS023182 TaxID=2033492 RepID=UPI000BF287CE|nr:hypothetical protein [Bacillus sp. AFS023182]PFD97120.1 hypothetical protein CN288_22780 [Bacillus sp. AFS023182]PGX94290.1 hypothetical protein COE15_22540 [Bacillus cereus]
MGRYPAIVITKELDNCDYAIYSFGPSIEMCNEYPEMCERWRFKLLKDKLTVEEGYVLLDYIPKKHISLFYKCIIKIHKQIENDGGMKNLKNIDLPNDISFS